MTELFHNFGYVFLWSVFVANVAAEKVLPPEDVRLSWSGDLYPELTWAPPKHSLSNCRYDIESNVSDNPVYQMMAEVYQKQPLHWVGGPLKGGYLNISIKTVCNGRSSEAKFIGLDDPDLKLTCAIVSPSQVHCSWDSPPSAQLQFFYNVAVERNKDKFTKLQECPHYSAGRSGCDLPIKIKHSDSTLDLSELPLNFLLKGTLGDRTIRNSHYIQLLNFKLPPLKWTVEESKKSFIINWIPPAINRYWQYNINYTIKCGEENSTKQSNSLEVPPPPYELIRRANCSYDISIRGRVGDIGGTEWTAEKHFGVVSDSNPARWALALIPLLLAALVVLTLFCCMRNKDKIWPKVPTPNTELFKDLLNNNNKANFYLPKAEEECEVTLVIDPKQPGL